MAARTVNGASIHYEEAGQQGTPTIVLLHGFPLDSRVFDAQQAALSDQFRVITPDLRGFGRSASDQPFTMESIADDMHGLMKEIGALPAILGGLSMGGYAALAYSKKYPTELKGVILIDTRAEGDSPEGREARDKMIELVRQKGPSAVADEMLPKMLAPETPARSPKVARDLRAIIESQSPRTIENALVALRDRPDFRCDIPSIADPTLILVGEADALTPPAMAQMLHECIPNSRLVKIANAGHMTPMEQPEQVNRAIRDFASKLA